MDPLSCLKLDPSTFSVDIHSFLVSGQPLLYSTLCSVFDLILATEDPDMKNTITTNFLRLVVKAVQKDFLAVVSLMLTRIFVYRGTPLRSVPGGVLNLRMSRVAVVEAISASTKRISCQTVLEIASSYDHNLGCAAKIIRSTVSPEDIRRTDPLTVMRVYQDMKRISKERDMNSKKEILRLLLSLSSGPEAMYLIPFDEASHDIFLGEKRFLQQLSRAWITELARSKGVITKAEKSIVNAYELVGGGILPYGLLMREVGIWGLQDWAQGLQTKSDAEIEQIMEQEERRVEERLR